MNITLIPQPTRIALQCNTYAEGVHQLIILSAENSDQLMDYCAGMAKFIDCIIEVVPLGDYAKISSGVFDQIIILDDAEPDAKLLRRCISSTIPEELRIIRLGD